MQSDMIEALLEPLGRSLYVQRWMQTDPLNVKRWGRAKRVKVAGRQFLLREKGLQVAPVCWMYETCIHQLSQTENYELLIVA